MAMPQLELSTTDTLQDALERLGSVPLRRIRWKPAPGTATEPDLLAGLAAKERLLELVDGILIEKPTSFRKALLTVRLVGELGRYREGHDIGFVLGPSAPLRLQSGSVRLPDVSFVLWKHFPDRILPAGEIAPVAPDLAVEVISPGNTPAEMDRKLREYFAAGTRLAWLVYPETRTARVHHSPDLYRTLTETDVLDGEDVLPGFQLSIRDWFKQAGRRRGR